MVVFILIKPGKLDRLEVTPEFNVKLDAYPQDVFHHAADTLGTISESDSSNNIGNNIKNRLLTISSTLSFCEHNHRREKHYDYAYIRHIIYQEICYRIAFCLGYEWRVFACDYLAIQIRDSHR